MLPANDNTRVYYMPAAGYEETVSDACTFRAWDQTGSNYTNAGAAGTTVGTSYTGGVLPFSVDADTISISVQPTLVGTAGIDTQVGGASASNISALSAVNTAVIEGGAGVNTFKLDGAAITLDLSNATVAAKVNNFSVLDVKGSGNNIVKLALQDVLDMGAVPDNAATSVNETDMLVIKGNAGDVLQLKTGSGWTALTGQSGITASSMFGSEFGFEAGHTYTRYTQGTATLFVDELMTRSLV